MLDEDGRFAELEEVKRMHMKSCQNSLKRMDDALESLSKKGVEVPPDLFSGPSRWWQVDDKNGKELIRYRFKREDKMILFEILNECDDANDCLKRLIDAAKELSWPILDIKESKEKIKNLKKENLPLDLYLTDIYSGRQFPIRIQELKDD